MIQCNLCLHNKLLPLIDFGDHPIAKHYLSHPSCVQPTWPVKLYFCEYCGLTQLVDACPPDILYSNYITLSTWKFQPLVQRQISNMKMLEGIDGDSKVIEIGSNDGMFLYQMKLNGFKNVLGVEPAEDAFSESQKKGIPTVNDFLNSKVALEIKSKYGMFDIFISRQNLEHIKELQDIAVSIKTLLKPGGYVLIEVPNFDCNLRSKDYSLWEEHVNYFTLETLQYFLAMAEIEIISKEVFLFSGEGIYVIGRKVTSIAIKPLNVSRLREKNIEYAAFWPSFRGSINKVLSEYKQEGKKIAIYGAGSRVFCLINFSGIAQYLDIIVDDQVEKQNKFMPGGKLPILESDALYRNGIDLCLLGVNTENEDRAISKHLEWINRGGIFFSILPPSNRLLPLWPKTQNPSIYEPI